MHKTRRGRSGGQKVALHPSKLNAFVYVALFACVSQNPSVLCEANTVPVDFVVVVSYCFHCTSIHTVFCPVFSVLSCVQCFVLCSVFCPVYSVLSCVQCFVPCTVFCPVFSGLSCVQCFSR